MSFIYDDLNLLGKLLKYGQDPAKAANLDKLRGAVNTLLHEYDAGPSAGPEISHEGEAAEAKIRTQDLKDLGTLLSYLEIAKITVNGQIIVYGGDPNNENYKFYTLENTNIVGRNPGEAGFYINLELLRYYLESLLKNSDNALVSNMIKARIQDANQQLSAKISDKQQQKQQEQKPGQQQTQQSQAGGQPKKVQRG